MSYGFVDSFRAGPGCSCSKAVYKPLLHTRSENKVRELATVCLPWQHWTKPLVWFNDFEESLYRNHYSQQLKKELSEIHENKTFPITNTTTYPALSCPETDQSNKLIKFNIIFSTFN